MYDREAAPTEAQVSKYKDLSPMLHSALNEIREFAKKKQDGLVSATKIRILNRLLKDIQTLLSVEDSLQYLDLLSETDLPQNSDVVVILGQYEAALQNFSRRHHRQVNYESIWITKEWIDKKTEEGAEVDEDYEEADEEDGGDEDGDYEDANEEDGGGDDAE